tara:strand:+ start:517 stop:693 length:177 start_codon:yes stop_codon:yes gene_type:complete
MTLTEAKQIATENGNYVGKITATKDRQGEYTIYNEGRMIGEGYFDSATDAKIDALTNL